MKNKKFNTQAEDVIEVTIDKEDKEDTTMNEETKNAQETETADANKTAETKPEKKHKVREALGNGVIKFVGFTQKHPILTTATTAIVSGAVSAFVAYKFGVHTGEDGFLDKWAEDLAKETRESGVKDIVGMTKDGVITDLHDICGSDKIYDAVIAAAQILNPVEGTGIHIGRHDDVIEVTSTFWEAVADKIADNATDASDISDTTEAVQEILDSVTEL